MPWWRDRRIRIVDASRCVLSAVMIRDEDECETVFGRARHAVLVQDADRCARDRSRCGHRATHRRASRSHALIPGLASPLPLGSLPWHFCVQTSVDVAFETFVKQQPRQKRDLQVLHNQLRVLIQASATSPIVIFSRLDVPFYRLIL